MSDFYEYMSQADRIVDAIKNPMDRPVSIKEPEPFRNTRLMYAENSGDVAEYPQAKTAIRYAEMAGFTVDQNPQGYDAVASRPDMPHDVYKLQQLRNGKWVWNRK